jgi:glycosyltransferase involved in cell wall biosynthesis
VNVVVVTDFAYVNGGNAAVALSSALGLAQQGHTVTLLAGTGPVDRRIQSSPITVHCTNQRPIGDDPNRTRAMVQGLWNATASGMMARVLNGMDLRRTVVHFHGWDKVLSSSVIRMALTMGAKVVCTYHDYGSVCPNGGFYNHPMDKICHLRPLSSACVREQCDRHGYTHKLWRVARNVTQQRWGRVPGSIKHVIVVSEFSQRILEPLLPPSTRIHHVRNIIDIPRQEPVRSDAHAPYVMVGRLSREKGPHLLAAVAQKTGWPVRFVGNGESAALIRSLSPTSVVTGWLSHDLVQKELSSARALIFPSLWYETEGLVVLEAAAIGVPSIVADSCAARDLVADGETGIHFRGGDEQDLKLAMERLQDLQVVRRLGEAAYRQYWSHPRLVKSHVADLEQVYETVLQDE